MKNSIIVLLLSLIIFSCNRNDDICESGEATPRIKLKFKTQSTGKLKTLDSVFVKVDFGNGKYGVLNQKFATDSLLLPLRVDNSGYTDVYIGTSQSQFSVIRFSYDVQNEYVSPACGMKVIYKNISAALTTPNPVKALQRNQKNITNEQKTHYYLLF